MTLSPEELRAHFDYDPRSGCLTWSKPTADQVKVGDRAGWVTEGGYLKLSVKGRRYYNHRVIWAIHYGEWPNALIDHINGNGLDNRIENLRLCNSTQNGANSKINVNNTTGLKGVAYRPGRKLPYCARIVERGRQVWLGSFATGEEAHKAYTEAARRLWGDFANVG